MSTKMNNKNFNFLNYVWVNKIFNNKFVEIMVGI